MPDWLALQVARLLTYKGTSAWIMACTLAGAAAGAAALTPSSTVPARSTPAPQATAAPCMMFVGYGSHGCPGQFWYGRHHFGHWRHHRPWGDGWWQGQAQPTPAVPNSPNGGTVGLPVNNASLDGR